jgi:DNA-binding response OmpR family regulator
MAVEKASRPQVRKPLILVVDDNNLDRQLTARMLQKNGYLVAAISGAEQILEVIVREKPDLVLLDIMMPGISGDAALKNIRDKYSQVELPVIMVTSKTATRDIAAALKSGANDFITKPVEFEVAFRRIDTHLAMALQSRNMARASEINAIHSMVTTYNHEFNNPLTIALGNLTILKTESPEDERIKAMENALWRVAEIVQKTNLLLAKSSVEYERYMHEIQMLDLKNSSNRDATEGT